MEKSKGDTAVPCGDDVGFVLPQQLVKVRLPQLQDDGDQAPSPVHLCRGYVAVVGLGVMVATMRSLSDEKPTCSPTHSTLLLLLRRKKKTDRNTSHQLTHLIETKKTKHIYKRQHESRPVGY